MADEQKREKLEEIEEVDQDRKEAKVEEESTLSANNESAPEQQDNSLEVAKEVAKVEAEPSAEVDYRLAESVSIDITSGKDKSEVEKYNEEHSEELEEQVSKTARKGSSQFEKTGWLRHSIAIFALIGIVLANMNRQAFNQALSRMVCKEIKHTTNITVSPTTDFSSPTTPSYFYPSTLAPTITTTPALTDYNTEPVTDITTPFHDTESTVEPTTARLVDETGSATEQTATTTPPLVAESTTTSEFEDGLEGSAEPTTPSVGPDTGSTSEATTLSFKRNEQQSTTVSSEVNSNPRNYNPELDCFYWGSEEISKLQSAFSWGYTPLMIFSARISELYGAKWMIFLSTIGSALCCISSPYFADQALGFHLLVGSRVLMGLSQTGVSPAIYALLVRWLPQDESSLYLPMMKVSATLGFTFGSVIAGFFSWRMTFYIVAGICLCWCLLWPFLAESDPKDSRLITRGEFNYIRQEIHKLTKNRKESAGTVRKKSAPWLAIFTHPVVLAFMFTKLTVKMSTDVQTQQLVWYLDEVFHMSHSMNGLLNGFNYAIQALLTGLVAWTAREFVTRKAFGLNKTGVRRLFQGIGNFGMGFAFISITFNMGSLTLVCISYFVLSITSMFVSGGESIIPIDLSTDYAATIMSIANFTANLSGIVLPKLVAIILGDARSNPDRWNQVWWIMGGVMCSGGVIFCTVARAEILNFEQSKLVVLVNYISGCFRSGPKKEKEEDEGEEKRDFEDMENGIKMKELKSSSEIRL